MVAKAQRKPFYVAVESYKFARMYPLSQRDISDIYGISPQEDEDEGGGVGVGIGVGGTPSPAAVGSGSRRTAGVDYPTVASMIDFTPADYITLLFTDLGVLTPAAVSDELIKLYS